MKDQHRDRLDEDRRVAIRPDLLFSSQGTAKFVADIKYKLTDDGAGGRTADYYQLLAYTTALDLPEGVLIYCLNANLSDGPEDNGSIAGFPRRHATEGSASPGAAAASSVRVRHVGKVLHTYALDLSGTADDVGKNVRELADWIAQRAAASV